jgi:glycosyltransferase involved in cell wall biosynthesis
VQSSSRISVVIPTIRRPQIVCQAIQSVLAQTYSDFEIIVVIDGPDADTAAALARIDDKRLRVIALTQNVGLAEVRNIGSQHAVGEWVAFLDDDDEWLPEKLARQVAAAEAMGGSRVFVACRYIEQNSDFKRILPYRFPESGEPLSEYLFCRRGLSSVCGLLQPSTYFVSRRLVLEVPFRRLRPHEDFDWLMRISNCVDRPPFVVADALSIYHNEKQVGREGTAGDFSFFFEYATKNRNLFTKLSLSYYLAIYCAGAAAVSAAPFSSFRKLVGAMFRYGSINLKCILFLLLYCMFPSASLRKMRHRITGLVT